MADVPVRHHPGLAPALEGSTNAFAPWNSVGARTIRPERAGGESVQAAPWFGPAPAPAAPGLANHGSDLGELQLQLVGAGRVDAI